MSSKCHLCKLEIIKGQVLTLGHITCYKTITRIKTFKRNKLLCVFDNFLTNQV